MSVVRQPERFLATALAAAIMSGLVAGWSPRYWAISLAVVSISAVGAIWAVISLRPRVDWRIFLIAAIVLWAPAQVLLGSSANNALTERASLAWAVSGVVFVLAFQVSGNRARHWFLQLVLGAAVVLAIAAIIQKYGFPTQVFGLFSGPSSVFGTFIYENQFAAFMEIAAPIALWRILRGDLIYGGVCYAIMFAATIVSASRAGVVLVLLELVIFLAVGLLTRHFSTRASLPVFAVIFVLVSAAALIVGTDVIQERFESRVPERARVDLGYATLHMIRLRPATGFGMGAWPLAYPAFATFDLGAIANEAHDDWLQWTAEGGIPFALLIAILAGSLMLPAVRSIWGVGFLIVLVHSLVDYVLREPALAILWFAIGGMLCGYAQKTAGESLGSASGE